MKIRDKVFAVTGAGNGIGQQVALVLVARGAHVAAIDIDGEALGRTAALAAVEGRVTTHVVDITDRNAVADLLDEFTAVHRHIDGLINIAGVVHTFTPLAELGFDDMERVMTVNFWGTVNVTKTFLPALVARPEASLVNVASLGALVPFSGQGAYCASKAAVELFTETLSAEHRTTGLTVSVVFPGPVATDILNNSGVPPRHSPEETEKLVGRITSAEAAAHTIVGAVESGASRVIIGREAKILDWLARLAPTWTVRLVAGRMAGGAGRRTAASPVKR